MADPLLYLDAAGVLAGVVLFFFFAYRWTASEAQEAESFEPTPVEPAEPVLPEAQEPPELYGELAQLKLAVERLTRVQEDRLSRIEARLNAIEHRLAAFLRKPAEHAPQ